REVQPVEIRAHEILEDLVRENRAVAGRANLDTSGFGLSNDRPELLVHERLADTDQANLRGARDLAEDPPELFKREACPGAGQEWVDAERALEVAENGRFYLQKQRGTPHHHRLAIIVAGRGQGTRHSRYPRAT